MKHISTVYNRQLLQMVAFLSEFNRKLDEKQANDLLEQIRVGGVMTLHPPVIKPDTPLREALQLFAQTGRHGLPVVDNGALVGLLTEESVLQATAAVLKEFEQWPAMQ